MANLRSQFLEHSSSMRAWVPENPPSNRDRLELYALHKQAAAGDCNSTKPVGSSVADKAKWSAWKTKSGLSQAEAMSRYISECKRQVRVYGSRAGPSVTDIERETPHVTSVNPNEGNRNTAQGPNHSLLRGVDSVPFLSSAASEPFPTYMQRMSLQNVSHSWWSRRTPLLGPASPSEPTFTSKIENGLITVGSLLESFALRSSSLGPFPASSVHAFVYPLHILLITLWILLIYLLTIPTTAYLLTKTTLMGSNSTGVTLSQLIDASVTPTSTVASGLLSDAKNSLPVRALGLSLTPLCIITDVSLSLNGGLGDLTAAAFYVFGVLATWWYWVFVVPWLGVAVGWVGLGYGVCLAVIEVAGV